MTLSERRFGNVLVTGGRGFIGRCLVRRLAEHATRVVSLDIAPIMSRASSNIQEMMVDIRDISAVQRVMSERTIDYVFDLASLTDVHLPDNAYNRNIEQVLAMVNTMAAFKQSKYIFFSTQFVHRVPGYMPESDDEYAPIEPYGASKVGCEKAIKESLNKEQWLILRPSYIWGAGLPRFRDGLLKNLMRNVLLIPSEGNVRRYYGYVETIVDQAIMLASQAFANIQHRVYYVSDDAIHLSDFCDPFIALAGRGGYFRVPVGTIRALGDAGDLMRRAGLPTPVNKMQATELTTNFPIPIGRTLAATNITTNLEAAAHATLEWAEMLRKR